MPRKIPKAPEPKPIGPPAMGRITSPRPRPKPTPTPKPLPYPIMQPDLKTREEWFKRYRAAPPAKLTSPKPVGSDKKKRVR